MLVLEIAAGIVLGFVILAFWEIALGIVLIVLGIGFILVFLDALSRKEVWTQILGGIVFVSALAYSAITNFRDWKAKRKPPL